jgi:hypothetical protein
MLLIKPEWFWIKKETTKNGAATARKDLEAD